jgi:hypothetical protein
VIPKFFNDNDEGSAAVTRDLPGMKTQGGVPCFALGKKPFRIDAVAYGMH